MEAIRDLFERDPDREVVGVVKITERDPARVWVEMDEYVATEEVCGYFREFLERFVESRRSPGEDVCVWVSGFFGSGKSHFLKVLGYLLENHELLGPAGHPLSSTTFLGAKLGLANFVPLLTREFVTRVLFIDLLDRDPERSTISRLIYRRILESKGLSREFWVAAWEEEIQKLEKWEVFKDWVVRRYGRSWEEERRLNADSVLTRALVELLPERYPDETASRRAIDDSKVQYAEVRPGDVARRLRQEAEALDPSKGRMVVLLDEVGLYVGDNPDRVTDLNNLAEKVVVEGRGKVWLVATAQEALADLVGRLATDRHILAWLQDRFHLRFQLTPGNIERVVCERLLKKRPAGVTSLQSLYERSAGVLTAGAILQGVAGGRIPTALTPERFIAFYPLLPYHISLLQEAFSTLRQRGGGSEEARRRLAGRERSMLQTIHAVLRGEGNISAFANRNIGELITFDALYDAVGSELSIIQSDHHDAITNRVTGVTVEGGLPAPQVAKALFLLQQVGDWLPTSLANVAAVLCPRVDADVHAHREAVRHTLEALKAAGWVVQEQGIYRFLSPAEYGFEQEVAASQPTPAEKKEAVVGLTRELLRRFRYEHGERARRPLPVSIRIDGQETAEAGDLKLVLYTPLAHKDGDEVLVESLNSADTVFLLASEMPEFGALIERTLAIEKALARWRGREVSGEQQDYMERLRREADENRQNRLPQMLERAFLSGSLIMEGVETRPAASSLAAACSGALREIATRLFTEFVDLHLRDQDCTAILGWRPGVALPQAYQDLSLIGAGGIRIDCRAASILLAELNRRRQQGLECTGDVLTEHFERRPYGWSPALLRLVMAALFKNGNVSLQVGGDHITDPANPKAQQIFGNQRQFRHVTFRILPPVDWRRARALLVDLTGEATGNTCEEVGEKLAAVAATWYREADRLATRAQDYRLPSALWGPVRRVSEALAAVDGQSDSNARMRAFLEREEVLRENVPLFRRLSAFEAKFALYRQISEFVQEAYGWGRELSGEMKDRWTGLVEGLDSPDLLDRFGDLEAAFAVLLDAYQAEYLRRHAALGRAAAEAIARAREHAAFPTDRAQAERLLAPLNGLSCSRADLPAGSLVCPACRLRYGELDPARVARLEQQIIEELDALLPSEGEGPEVTEIEPLERQVSIGGPSDLEPLFAEIRRYVRRNPGRRLLVRVAVVPEEGGA